VVCHSIDAEEALRLQQLAAPSIKTVLLTLPDKPALPESIDTTLGPEWVIHAVRKAVRSAARRAQSASA
jgi:hypothetical protein